MAASKATESVGAVEALARFAGLALDKLMASKSRGRASVSLGAEFVLSFREEALHGEIERISRRLGTGFATAGCFSAESGETGAEPPVGSWEEAGHG